MSDPLIGTTVAHYDVLEKLGGGAMGIVYRARDTRLGRQVALKFLPAMWMHDDEARQRFVREAQAASATDHRNICTIHDIGSADDGRMFLVMALYEGPTLKQRIAEGPMPIEEALDVATQVAEGLAKAHAAGVVHRDIKPGNLILTEDAVKIVDFGLAKFADSLHLTTAGTSLGTAAYMSPEQVRGEEVGPAGDVWAVGVILYEMLAGHPPFRGGYAEAIAHAIRHDAPASLRANRPDVPEDVEQVVFRALHKQPTVRYASGRELARALRMARGQSMPQDLMTQVVSRPVGQPLPALSSPARSERVWLYRLLVAAACLAIVATVGTAWILWPAPRVPVLLAPVLNQTGDADLDGYRLALTWSLVEQLRSGSRMQVVSYPRMLQALRRYQTGGADVGSREALQALTQGSAARLVVLPTFIREGGTWRGRVELRDASTAVAVAAYDTPGIVSSLGKDTTYRLASAMAALVDAHFSPSWPRGLFTAHVRPEPALASLDAAKAFEAGVSWYEEQEFARAAEAFASAAAADGRNPLVQAWIARVALVMRRDADARVSADRAQSLVTDQTAADDRSFVEAVLAESRGQLDEAERHLMDLRSRHPDDAATVMEVAAFRDRRASSRDGWTRAVTDYHEALAIDPGLIRPRIELCRLYNRLQEPSNAKAQGQQALAAAQKAGWSGGEALARFCLVDGLRGGTSQERAESAVHANRALATLQRLGYSYNLSRALYYVGMVAGVDGRFSEAASLWQQASAQAASSGNVVLQPLLLMNLGVAHQRLGDVSRALDYYARSGASYEQLGDERRAAQQQANAAALRVAYGRDMDAGLRDARNALAVLQNLGDAEFEVACRTAIGAYYRFAGRFDEAERELNLGLAKARERNLGQRVAATSVSLANVSFDRGDYGETRRRLLDVVKDGGRAGALAWALLARAQTRLGDFGAADTSLQTAERDLERRQDVGLRPLLDLARGELAYESGRFAEAREHFSRAAASGDEDDATVWARVFVASAQLASRAKPDVRDLSAAATEAQRRGRVALEATARVVWARALLAGGQPSGAVRRARV
jgi:tetratricopeptide (TPR) repeat protein